MAEKKQDKLSAGGAILSFLFPPVGVYHYFSNKDGNSTKANTAIGLALMGLIGNYFAYAKMNEWESKKFVGRISAIPPQTVNGLKELPTPVVKSKGVVSLPDGFYVGNVGGWTLTILSQDYFNTKIDLEFGIRTQSMPVSVVVQNGIAYCYDNAFQLT
ncbi:hypothetical protein [Bernardetia sp.]|uniref:hypothetical protein n=1 Tax=Bernardetia sp. TaxID=1937974 RepID=UPI0025C6B56D|nr:hypothetical protein [Bernardetia sp.]